MSSSTATLLPLSPTDGSGETAGASHGLNYFYGFLLTSVGLLVIFIVCGIGSRQRFTSRRVNYALETGRSLNDKLEGGETPQFYEPLFVTGEDKWSGLMVYATQIPCTMKLIFWGDLAVICQMFQRERERFNCTRLGSSTATHTRTS